MVQSYAKEPQNHSNSIQEKHPAVVGYGRSLPFQATEPNCKPHSCYAAILQHQMCKNGSVADALRRKQQSGVILAMQENCSKK